MPTSTKSETAAKRDVTKLQRAIVDGLEDVKAHDIQVFNTEAQTSLFERVIVASGTSNRQTKALATSVREATREMLVELGCAIGPWSDMVTDRATRTERPRIRLPWSREGDSR